MKFTYSVSIDSIEEVHEIPGTWTRADYVSLLTHLDYPDPESVSEEEMKDMAALALSDLGPEEAAILLMEIRMGDKLNSGQRVNLAEEFKDTELWQRYSDIRMHKDFFVVGWMLHQAFPSTFRNPEITSISLTIKALNGDSITNLETPSAPFLCRILNDGMTERNTIYRLFGDNIESNEFDEADAILWKWTTSGYSEKDKPVSFTIFTALHWVEELRSRQEYNSAAYGDHQHEEE